MEPRNSIAPVLSDQQKAHDLASLSFIERIYWFEHERPMTADNDNTTTREEDDACFQSWARPVFMRK